MSFSNVVASIGGLISWGAVLVFALFANLVLKKNAGSIIGTSIPMEYVHVILGPIIVLVNAAIFLFTAALSRMPYEASDLALAKAHQVYWVLGPVFNPFFVSETGALNAIGYAFMIVLWWVGMYCFLYSTEMNADAPFLYAWKILISVLYLACGLLSMIAIQACWSKFGEDAYSLKWKCAFVGIAIGGALPFLTGRPMPRIM